MSRSSLNTMDVYKLLNKSNCGECGLPTCLVFATLAVQGRKELKDCPYLDSEVIEQLSGGITSQPTIEEQQLQMLEDLKQEIRDVDFPSAAKRLGVSLKNDQLVIRCLGRIFAVDQQGNLHTHCHVNPWIHLPILNYILRCKDGAITGKWVPFEEHDDAPHWSRFFNKRCVEGLHRLADEQGDLFFDILDLFGSATVIKDFTADRKFILYPLPKVPVLFCYWKPEGEFESKFSLYFDSSFNATLSGGALYQLGQGMVEMFKKIGYRHGHQTDW